MGRQGPDDRRPTVVATEPPRRTPATLRDVAGRAGVDPSVVSRIVNADPGLRVSGPTRARVEAAIAELDYRPNVQARGLRLAKTWTVGVVIPDLSNPFYPPIIEGASQRAAEGGYMVVVVRELDRSILDAEEPAFARLLHQHRVDGLLIASGRVDDEVIRGLAAEGQPTVVVNRRVPGVVGSVIVDDEAAAHLGTSYLASLGHRRIGHVAGPPAIDNSVRRRRGFERAVAEAGGQAVTVHGEGWDAESGHRAAASLLQDPDVTAVLATNFVVAVGVMGAARDAGRAVPGDVSVLALHDSPVAGYMEPAVSTVVLPLEQLGRVAFDELLGRLDGAEPREVVVGDEPRLIVRSSTAPAR